MFHGVLLAVIVFQGDRLWQRTLAPGAPALFLIQGGGGGGGGPRGAYITLPSSPQPAPQPPTPVPPPEQPPEAVPTPVAEVEVPTPVAPTPIDSTPVVAAADSAPAAGGTGAGDGGRGGGGAGEGPGEGTGTGEGRGPGIGGGGGVIRPPELRDLSFPFETPPKELRGQSLAVTFWVRVDGKVERYEVQPVIIDRDYAQKFDEVIRAFRFRPARAPDGSHIAGTTRVTFTLPGKRSS